MQIGTHEDLISKPFLVSYNLEEMEKSLKHIRSGIHYLLRTTKGLSTVPLAFNLSSQTLGTLFHSL